MEYFQNQSHTEMSQFMLEFMNGYTSLKKCLGQLLQSGLFSREVKH